MSKGYLRHVSVNTVITIALALAGMYLLHAGSGYPRIDATFRADLGAALAYFLGMVVLGAATFIETTTLCRFIEPWILHRFSPSDISPWAVGVFYLASIAWFLWVIIWAIVGGVDDPRPLFVALVLTSVAAASVANWAEMITRKDELARH